MSNLSGSRIWRAVCGFVRALWLLLGPAPGRSGLKRWLLQVATLGAVAGVGGFLFAALGLAPIKASSDHWPMTAWFLEFSMSRSVAVHTLGLKAPALEDRGMILKGATHYETGCSPCHGSPAFHGPRIAREMTPPPPYLPPTIHEWSPEELFYIVKHGVKFTGMPAWPAQQRDDEVWAMVAFLQVLPEWDEEHYRQAVDGRALLGNEADPLALKGTEDAFPAITVSCQRCHGIGGQGRGVGVFPKLAGRPRVYLEASLDAYAKGRRHSGIMEPIAVALTHDEIGEVARFYSGLIAPISSSRVQSSDPSVIRGAAIAREGVPNQRIPICVECHGPGQHLRNPAYPTLAGQYADYLVLQLELFADGHRGGSEYAHLMDPVARRLTPQQRRDVARYYESLAVPVMTKAP